MNTPSTAERKALALQRLDASRTALIQRLYPPPEAGSGTPPGGTSGLGAAHWLTMVLARVGRDGWVRGAGRTVRALARRWWKHQPWHGSVELVAHTAAREARPLVRRHPWACMATAAAVGAGLMLARPWLTRAVRHQAQDWRGHLGTALWQQLAQAPVQLALAGALSAWLSDLSRRAPPSGPEP